MRKKTTQSVPMGKRDRSKVERQAKILTAARMLFTEHGYEAATLNQIATIAGLGKGTIFNYVTDKRDLIFLIFHQDISSLVEKALAEAKVKQSFAEKILIIAELHYRLYAQNPKLTRILLNEVGFHSEGVHLDRFLELRARLIKGMEQVVTVAQKEGVVSTKETASFIAQQLFFCFSTAAREWLTTPHPEWRAGLRQFRRSLNLFLDGAGISPQKIA
jgi:AcrR family transcriptional regulator